MGAAIISEGTDRFLHGACALHNFKTALRAMVGAGVGARFDAGTHACAYL